MYYYSTPLTNRSTVTSNMIVSLLVNDTLIDQIIDNVSNHLPIDGRPRETDPDTDRAITPAIRMRFECDPTVIRMQTDQLIVPICLRSTIDQPIALIRLLSRTDKYRADTLTDRQELCQYTCGTTSRDLLIEPVQPFLQLAA
jgi:hypothetical protein